MPTEIIKVDGMSCDHCVQTITKALEAISSVKRVEVRLKEKEVLLGYEGGEDTLSSARSAIIEAGFELV